MLFRGKNIAEYTKEDIISLIENKVPESKTLDYKRELQFDERNKTELIYDISSFYNTDGGFMVVGLDEVRDGDNNGLGIPKLPDTLVKMGSYDSLQSSVQDRIRQTTNPSITKLQFSPLIDIDGTEVFVIGIPKRNGLPAMVTYSSQNRFYKRKSNGKYLLDTYELYETFTESEVLERKINSFIQDRQIKVSEDQFWPGTKELSALLMHVVPLSSFNTQIESFSDNKTREFLVEHFSAPCGQKYVTRYCFEGFHSIQQQSFYDDGDRLCYNLFFRNGATETFSTKQFSRAKTLLYIHGLELLEAIRDQLVRNYKLCKQFSIDQTVFVSIKLCNISNMLLTPAGANLGPNQTFDNLQLPTFLLSNNIDEAKRQLKLVMDVLWQTADVSECPARDFDRIFESLSIN